MSRYYLREIQVDPFTGKSPVDRILEDVMGSSYTIRHRIDPMTGDVTFEKVKDDGRKWHEPDPTRRLLYEEAPDGSLIHKRRK